MELPPRISAILQQPRHEQHLATVLARVDVFPVSGTTMSALALSLPGMRNHPQLSDTHPASEPVLIELRATCILAATFGT